MAFSSEQKAQIRKVMCAPTEIIIRRWGNPYAYYPLEDAMDAIGDDTETSAIVISALADIANIDAQLDDQVELGFVNKADEFNLNVPQGVAALQFRGRQKIKIIADALGLKPLGDYYSSAKTVLQSEFI